MTTFQIPEGKVVDRIELEAGEGSATLTIIYKEDKPKPKDTMVLVETEADTWIYRNTATGNLVHIVGQLHNPEKYIPLRQAEAGEFVVLPKNDVMAKLTALGAALSQLSDSVPLKAMPQEQKQVNKQLYDCFTALSELIPYSGSKSCPGHHNNPPPF